MKKRVARGSVTVTGPPLRDLLVEQGQDAAVRAEHVAEADHGEAGERPARERLHVVLGGALRGAHDAGGRHGLVGRDEGEVRDPVLVGEVGEAGRRPGVRGDRLERVQLAHGDVLERGGVEHDVGLLVAQQVGHAPQVADRREHGRRARAEERGDLPLDLVERRLRAVEEQQPAQAAAVALGQLPRQLPADAAARAGHEDGLVPEELRQADVRQVHRVPLEEGLLGNRQRLHDRRLAAQQGLDRGQHADVGDALDLAGDPPEHERRAPTGWPRSPGRRAGAAVSRARSRVVPRTFRPRSVVPCLSGSSSTKPMTSTAWRSVASRSFARAAPARPAPAMRTRLRASREVRDASRPSRWTRQARREADRRPIVSIQSMTSAPRERGRWPDTPRRTRTARLARVLLRTITTRSGMLA